MYQNSVMRLLAYLFDPLLYPLLRQESLLPAIICVFNSLNFSKYPVLGLSIPSLVHHRSCSGQPLCPR